MRSWILLFLLATACSARQSEQPPLSERTQIERQGNAVLQALAVRDAARLATLVHPEKGVRFSPYAYVRVDSDVVLTRAQIAGIYSDSTRRTWGRSDGSGEPIRLTFAQYAARFVYNADYLSAPMVAYDSLPLHSGNTPSNLATAYPGARHIEYHYPGFDPKYGGMDWTSLWLVFDRAGGDWCLVAIVHGMWTI